MAENGRNVDPSEMNRWSEANFLERLMSPSSHENNIDKKSPCPDSELLAAFSENQVDGFVSGAISAHLIHCADCAELHRRLLNLADVDLASDSAEWRNAEKRLDNWMNTYLRAHPSPMESEAQTRQIASTAGAGSGWKLHPWRIGWVLGAVAALELAAATILFLKLSVPSRAGHAEVAAQTAPLSPSPVSSVPSQEKAEPVLENLPKTASAQPEEGKPAKIQHSAAKPKPHAVPPSVPSADQNAARREERLEPPSNALNSPTPTLEMPATESAEHTSVLAEPLANASATPAAGNNSSKPMNAGKGFLPVVKSTPRSPANLPAIVSLEYSTSLWIQLSSDSPPADGTFQFQGTLLKPVELPAGVPFDTNTQVQGLGGVNDGRISLVIKEFFFQGARYRLKNGSGSARVESFNGGRTLETWIDEDSVYEWVGHAAPAAGSRPNSAALAEATKTSTPAHPK